MGVLTTDNRLPGVVDVRQGTPDHNEPFINQNASSSERPLDVGPTNQGGVAIDGRGDLPEGHANMSDKVIGKMQKVRIGLICALRSILILLFDHRSLESI